MCSQDLPGNRQCVSCHFVAGIVVVSVEVVVFYAVTTSLANCLIASKIQRDTRASGVAAASSSMPLALLRLTGSGVGKLLGALGWLFWTTYFSVYWNFISYVMCVHACCLLLCCGMGVCCVS